MSEILPTYSQHPIKRILSSCQPIMVVLKYMLVFLAATAGLLSIQLMVRSLGRPYVYQKDFIQEYLLARAVFERVDPYLPLPELALRFLGPLPNSVFQHSTPHPPPVALLSLPLSLLSYEQAAIAWLLFEMVCVVAALYLLLRWFDQQPHLVLILLITLLILGWGPFWKELITGQLMTLLLLLLSGAWLALRSGRKIAGGTLLGLTIALKLIAWPILIFLAVRKNWQTTIAAGVTAVIANLASALLMGFDHMLSYYREVGGTVSSLYHAYEHNFSLWTIGWRMFEGTGSPVVDGLNAPPLVEAPILARYVSAALPLCLLGVGLMAALRTRSFDTSFSILVCVSILVSPVAWSHYLVLVVVPLAVIGRWLYSLDWPRRETNLGLVLGLLLVISRTQLDKVILILSGQEPIIGIAAQTPFVIGLLSFLPAVALMGLIWLLWHLDQTFPQEILSASSGR